MAQQCLVATKPRDLGWCECHEVSNALEALAVNASHLGIVLKIMLGGSLAESRQPSPSGGAIWPSQNNH
jgi:hypothetical protein